MRKVWFAVLCACPLLACGASARTPQDPNASTGAGAPIGGESAGDDSANGGASGATDGSTGGGGRPVHLGSSSWDVTANYQFASSTPGLASRVPDDQRDFALTIDGETMTIGRNSEVYSAPVRIIDGAYVATDVRFPSAYSVERLLAKELTLRAIDSDGDGEADQLAASATLEETKTVGGDVYWEVIPSVTLSGLPDDSVPTLWPTLGLEAQTLDPLWGIRVYSSEPLAADAQVSLTGTSTISLSLPASDPTAGTPVANFGTSQILPFGGTWRLEAHGKDLAGHALEVKPAATFVTPADPGVQAQDGFEGTLRGVLGPASLVAGRGSIPALSGAQSLWTDSSITIHLQRTGDESHLHFAARSFFPGSNLLDRVVFVGVVGGSHVLTLTPPTNPQPTETGDEQYPSASNALQFDATLDEPGKDVLIEITNLPCTDPDYVWCARKKAEAWLIDDLELE